MSSRYKITIEYDGTGFAGWQRQRDALSIQEVIEDAIFRFSAHRVTLYAAGRTDAGVHAFGQVAHFDLETKHPPASIKSAINFFAKPHRISVLDIEVVGMDFHARFSCLNKTYLYQICNRDSAAAVMRDYVWGVREKLSVCSMKEAAQIFIGMHDFSTFRSAACQANSPFKSIDSIEIEMNKEIISIYITARSFLHNQVRIIVGGLCSVGSGRWSVQKLQNALEQRNRAQGPITAPANGLFLLKVRYSNEKAIF